jgi:hypothetical protein
MSRRLTPTSTPLPGTGTALPLYISSASDSDSSDSSSDSSDSSWINSSDSEVPVIQMDSDSSGSEYEAEALQCWRMWETKVHGAIEALGLDTLTTSEDMRRAEMILILDSTDSTEREQRPQFMPWCLPLNMEEPIMSAIATLYLYDTPNATDAMRVYIHHCVRHGGEHKMQVLLSEPTMLQHLSGILPLEYHLHLQNSYQHTWQQAGNMFGV